ncbi:hypothetical protein BABINDRAFT_73901 [Babjeviella inositovora NRRL Y-12698]|uniref:Nudix hydrolase domain-containing protein n=1 Tax=Babjeviella inositovora NRRL Y-12698 TaxID=984486 RepID=A0A1E3QYA1_9ASCO|nr:uncharacterized protein BABINDRAFT_73901 [Babjeviella inositovora NRRL Y-12698]ODQ82598.1 hypothetical protein BABINDRAFT_73901 [Babjeviella inositovora NRRL Y-12698]
MSFAKTTEAREGREHQCYSKATGARLVAGCIALNADKTKVIMITSTNSKSKWILPKGGIEADEAGDYLATALRETWEEAGITGKLTLKLGVVEDKRPPKKWNTKNEYGIMIPRTEFHFYEMQVEELAKEWPESNKRERRWCTYTEAKQELEKAKRPELVDALNSCSIDKQFKEST